MPWYTDNLGPMYIQPLSFNDYIREEIDKLTRQQIFVPDINWNIKYEIDLNNLKKETDKMEAKKCDRCGKLYEKKFDKNDIRCVFKHEDPFFTGDEKNYSKEYIEDKKTHSIYIKIGASGEWVDMCPDCRKAFKTWFESAEV